jgi:glycosyltransferase involved in cell wall biosynthesis
VAESSYPHLEILVVDDASEAKLDLALLDQIERASGRWSCGVKTVRSPVRVGLGGARNLGVASADGDYVLILEADDVLVPGFIELAAKALDEQPEHDGVVPAIAYFPSEEDLYQGIFADYDWFLGDAPALGLVVNHLGRGGLFRRSLFERLQYDEGLEHEEDWDFFLRLSHGGRRFLVTQSIQLYRPAPEGPTLAPDLRRMLQARMYRSLPKPPKASEFFAFLVQAEPARDPEWNHPFEPRPLRHHLVDGMNRGLQKLPLGARLPAVRYQWVDSVNLLLKKNQRLHSLIRGVLG